LTRRNLIRGHFLFVATPSRRSAILLRGACSCYHVQALMRFTHTARHRRSSTLLILSVLVSLCFSFNARLDALPYAHVTAGVAGAESVGASLTVSQAQALTNSVNTAWARVPSQAKIRVKRPSIYLDALTPGRADYQPAVRRFPRVQNCLDAYSSFNSPRPRGRAPPHVA
jgi:hypothetical protein